MLHLLTEKCSIYNKFIPNTDANINVLLHKTKKITKKSSPFGSFNFYFYIYTYILCGVYTLCV